MKKWIVIAENTLQQVHADSPEPARITHKMSDQTSASITKRVAWDGVFFNTTAEFEAEVSLEDRAVLRPFVAIWDQQDSVEGLCVLYPKQ